MEAKTENSRCTSVFSRTLPCCKLAKIDKNDTFLLNMKRFEDQVEHDFIR